MMPLNDDVLAPWADPNEALADPNNAWFSVKEAGASLCSVSPASTRC